jgi:hypothetical protein
VTDRDNEVIQHILRRESRSFLQYIGDTFPWPTRDGEEVEEQLRPLIEEERDAVAELGRFLARRRVPLPYVGPYPTPFTTSNFVSLHHLRPRLLAEERRAIAALEQDMAALRDPEARGLVQKLLDTKRHHLQALVEKSAPPPEPVAVAH